MSANNKSLEYYKSINYNIIIRREEMDGEVWFVAYCAEFGLDACHGTGNDEISAINSFKTEKDYFMEYLYSSDIEIPEPENDDLNSFSGVFTIRTTPWLHYKLVNQAKNQGVSLNSYINQILSFGLGSDMSLKQSVEILTDLKDSIIEPIKDVLERTNSIIYDKIELAKSPASLSCQNHLNYLTAS